MHREEPTPIGLKHCAGLKISTDADNILEGLRVARVRQVPHRRPGLAR
jgi:hypothetical protein